MAQKLKSREDWDQLLSSVDTILFDCDGQYTCCIRAAVSSVLSRTVLATIVIRVQFTCHN